MAPDQRRDEEQEETLRVTDRRRFTETGEEREQATEPGPGSPSEPPPGPGAEGRADPAEAGREAALPRYSDTGEPGIATVFLAFWQGALMNLGASDGSGQSLPVNLDAARESIELLRVLQVKTSGNLTAEEDQVLRQLLHEAQMAYVQVAGGARADGGEETP